MSGMNRPDRLLIGLCICSLLKKSLPMRTEFPKMKCIHVITPVKDSIDTTMCTVRSVMSSVVYKIPFTYTIYNDFSTPENTRRLHEETKGMNLEIVELSDLTNHPSPNYLLTLQHARKRALEAEAGLLIVESDVTIYDDTVQDIYDAVVEKRGCGIAAIVTTDEKGEINYPYLFARDWEVRAHSVRHHCSFCCTLLTPEFLRACDFDKLKRNKSWYDVTISRCSLDLDFRNFLFLDLRVKHKPHSSRPWKQQKYTNPLKYYWSKFLKGLDRI